MKLRKYRQDISYGAYSAKDILKEVPEDQVGTALKNQYLGNKLGIVLSSQVSGWWIFRKKWLLVLDCDSLVDKEKTLDELCLLGIKFKVIQSSPLHYWVVTNYIGSFKKCMLIMSAIPGVDKNFIEFCDKYEKIVLRVFPKEGYRPNTAQDFDSFSGRAKLWGELLQRWWGGESSGKGIVNWLITKQRGEIKKKEEEARILKTLEEEYAKAKLKEEERRKSKARRILRIEYESGKERQLRIAIPEEEK